MKPPVRDYVAAFLLALVLKVASRSYREAYVDLLARGYRDRDGRLS